MGMRFVTGEPAMRIGDALVIADPHFGAEYDYRKAGISMPSRTRDTGKRILSLLRQTRAKRLVVLGDVKHRIAVPSYQEERELPGLFGSIAEKASVEIVPGNHDGGLTELLDGITMHPSDGIMLGGFWVCHGHAWPPTEVMESEAIIMGHNHPQVEFRDKLGHAWREKAWIRARLSRRRLSARYDSLPKRLPDIIFMPAFGELVGGWAVNRLDDEGRQVGGLGPLTRCADMRHALAFMLDGTFLGEVSGI